jgi:hypothetical protein
VASSRPPAGLLERYGASTLPDRYLVDRTGKLIERYHGARAWQSAAARAHFQPLARYGR